MRDHKREPVFNIPTVILILLAILTAIQAARGLLSDEQNIKLIADLAFVPGRFSFLLDQTGLLDHLTEVARQSEFDGQLGQFLLTYPRPDMLWLTPLTYTLLHGDWTHLIFNCVWLAAFGSPVARRFGVSRFLLLGALCAIAGAALHFALNFYDLTPVIGASAAISGYMGAAARFVFQPGAMGGGPLASADPDLEAPPLASLGEMLRNRQTLAFVGFWFVSNLIVGLGAQSFGLSSAPVAWEAHLGGFLIGLLLAPFFDQRRKA